MERFLSNFSLQTSGESLVHCLEVTIRILFAAPYSLHSAAFACAKSAIGPAHGPPNFIAPIALKFLVQFLADPASPSSGETAKEVRFDRLAVHACIHLCNMGVEGAGGDI
jgi:hypothetical protein